MMMQTNTRGYWTSDREMQRLRSLAGVFQKTNRLLTGDREITVKMVDGQQHGMANVPGWSAYPEVFINYRAFQNFKNARTLVQLLGLNYHELSHLMFSPIAFKQQIDQKFWMAYNVLEDQRIESFFTAMYQPAGKYFTEMAVKFILSKQSAWGTAFLWTEGRSFLPLEIREEFEERFVLSTIMKNRAKRLIAEYKSFTREDFAHRRADVLVVIGEFKKILDRAMKSGSDTPNDGCGNPEGGAGTDPRTEKDAAKEDERRRREEEETGEDQSGFWEDEEEEDDDEDGQEPSDSDGDSDGDSEDDDEDGEDGADGADGDSDSEGDEGDGSDGGGSGEGDEDDQDDEASDSDGDSDGDGADGDLPGDEDGEDGASSSHGEDGDGDDDGEVNNDKDGDGGPSGGSASTSEQQWDDNELREYLDEIVDAVNDDEEVVKEVQQINEAMNDLSNIDVIDFGKEPHRDAEVTVPVASALRTITQHFRKLYAEVEPGWMYGSNVGRLNVGRYMQDPENYDEAFDEWDEGREHESGLEVFISLDISGSMSGLIVEASTAMWMIKRACDEVGAHTTVVGFHSDTRGLYDRQERANRQEIPVWSQLGGSTEPAQSFHLGRRVLSQSDMPNKLFVCITDGGWGNTNAETGKYESDMAGLIQSIPGTRMYVELGGSSYGYSYNEEEQKAFHVSKNISSPLDIVPLVEAAITQMLTQRRR